MDKEIISEATDLLFEFGNKHKEGTLDEAIKEYLDENANSDRFARVFDAALEIEKVKAYDGGLAESVALNEAESIYQSMEEGLGHWLANHVVNHFGSKGRALADKINANYELKQNYKTDKIGATRQDKKDFRRMYHAQRTANNSKVHEVYRALDKAKLNNKKEINDKRERIRKNELQQKNAVKRGDVNDLNKLQSERKALDTKNSKVRRKSKMDAVLSTGPTGGYYKKVVKKNQPSNLSNSSASSTKPKKVVESTESCSNILMQSIMEERKMAISFSDYDLYRALDENGYKPTNRNLDILKEGMDSGKYIVAVSNAAITESYSIDGQAAAILDENQYSITNEGISAVSDAIEDGRVLFLHE